MLGDGLCFPCELTRSKGVVLIQNGELVIVDDFKLYVEACDWWNKYIASQNTAYIELCGYLMPTCSGANGVSVHRFVLISNMFSMDITDKDNAEILMSLDKRNGKIDMFTCKEPFRRIAQDWNDLITGTVSLREVNGKLFCETTQQSVVVGSIFDDGFYLGEYYGAE